MVNYLSRRTNPTRYPAWSPAEVEVFGQSNMFAAFVEHSPDYVMVIYRDMRELGVKPFGQSKEFGMDLARWIQQNYHSVLVIGEDPLEGSDFGLKIMKRNRTGESLNR